MIGLDIARALVLLVVAAAPLQAFAARSFKQLVDQEITVVGNQLIALLYALAFILFLVGMVQFFFSYNAETREKGKQFAVWGIVGLVVLFAVWGLVRALLGILESLSA